MTHVHETAVVDTKAELGENVVVGPYAVIEGDVCIGADTRVGPHAVIAAGTRIGERCRIFSSAVIGTVPQDLKFGEERTFVDIGDETTIREFATINRATDYSYHTRVGSNCLLMAYAHVAHDCQIGNRVIIANAVNMGGHVIIDDFVGIGGLTAIHQFVKIGAHAFIGGGLRVQKDVPPYILAMGEPMRYGGLNTVGLKRRGFSNESLEQIKQAYKHIYRQKLTLGQATQTIRTHLPPTTEVNNILKFIEESDRGLLR